MYVSAMIIGALPDVGSFTVRQRRQGKDESALGITQDPRDILFGVRSERNGAPLLVGQKGKKAEGFVRAFL